jgi:HEAT repeat protein
MNIPNKLGFVLAFLMASLIACSQAGSPGAGGPAGEPGPGAGVDIHRTFEEVYADLIGDDGRKAGLAEEEITRRWEEFIPDLIATAAVMNPDVSPKAIEKIGYYDSDEAREVIRRGLDSTDRQILLASITAAGRQADNDALDKLMRFTSSDDAAIRGRAATAIAYFPDSPDVRIRLREMTGDDEIIVRMAAYSGIGKVADPDADRLLFEALIREAEPASAGTDEGRFATFIIAGALRNVIDEEDCGWLVDGLDPGYPREVRYMAFDAMAKLHCSGAVDTLIDISRNTEEDDMARFRAGFSLAYIGDPRGYKAADDVYFAADQGLLKIDEANFPTYRTTMAQYRDLLDEMKAAADGD